MLTCFCCFAIYMNMAMTQGGRRTYFAIAPACFLEFYLSEGPAACCPQEAIKIIGEADEGTYVQVGAEFTVSICTALHCCPDAVAYQTTADL